MAATSGGASETDRPWQSYHTVYTNAKAGMEGVDKEKIQKIIYEMSKGSKYFVNEQRKESIINEKVEKLKLHQTNLTENEISHFQMIADNKIVELEATRDLSKVWLHVDMDAFYAAIETLEKPLLKEKPLAVGSMSMICTANYEARKYGVRAAMPGFIARKLCSKLILVPTNMEKYCHYSGMTRKVFHKYDPNFMAAGLDEAYLDVTTVCNDLKKSGEQIAEELRSGVFEATGLTCSAGVAPNRLLAKVCSDINKPNGQFVLPNDRRAVMAFISSLPIRKISGIGKVTEQVLKNLLGISTCEEMLSKRAFICALFSSCSSDFFLSVALGIGQTSTSWKPRRSISTERTFSSTSVEALLHEKLADIAETLSIDMQKDGLRGRTLTLKLKTASFEVRTRAVSLRRYIFSKDDILAHATKLLKDEMPISLRLIGLRMSQLNDDLSVEDPTQKTLDSFFLSDVMPVNDISCNYFDNSTDDDCKKEEAGFTFSFKSQEPLLSNLDINGKRTADPIKWLDSNSASYCLTPCRVGETEKGFRPIDSTGRPNQEETEKLDVSCFGTNLTDSEDVPSSIVEQQPFWINDSRCSVCGLELPPSFSMERQEHSDYHLAEMLQKEECPVPAQRTVHAHGSIFVKKNGRKRHKSSPTEVKQNRIDRFFVKDKL